MSDFRDYRNHPNNLTLGEPEYTYQDLSVLAFAELKTRGHQLAHAAAELIHACLDRKQCDLHLNENCYSVARMLEEARREWRTRAARQNTPRMFVESFEEMNEGWDEIKDNCPFCQAIRIQVQDSLNFGNVLARCTRCGSNWDHTEIDHKGILAEAKRGF